MTDDNNKRRILNSDIWEKLNEVENNLVRIETNQIWMRENLKDIQDNANGNLMTSTDQVKQLTTHVNDEIKIATERITALEKSTWYQRGFYAGVGAIITLLAIVIPNLDKIL
jgi:hypothetical protein